MHLLNICNNFNNGHKRIATQSNIELNNAESIAVYYSNK